MSIVFRKGELLFCLGLGNTLYVAPKGDLLVFGSDCDELAVESLGMTTGGGGAHLLLLLLLRFTTEKVG